ncbi:hypothetical protein [Bacillus nitratireducens]|uniref:hypothetical protein n=1 Tax=Bacillus nitratireducens TaxID=2026193 RepID=UPI002E23C185|nr:hypothetical protein [Bacillus nitratireducens]
MSVASPRLIVEKLIVVGVEKNYVVDFETGLNIIYGDSDTGKSSILNLIDYLLGSKKVYLYEEIEKKGKYALLQVRLNDIVYSIKRDIFKPEDYIEVYKSDIQSMGKVFPKIYGPNYKKEGPSGYFSDFLLQSLNIPLIRVKKAPTKSDSGLVRMSFRDIFKYCYLNQDDIGSRQLLDATNGAVAVKNRLTFQFIYNLSDEAISKLEQEIQSKIEQKKENQKQYKIISSFLRDAQFQTIDEIEDFMGEVKQKVENITQEIELMDINMKADTVQLELSRTEIADIEQKLRKLETNKQYTKAILEQNITLKKDYERDLQKLNLSLKMAENLPSHLPKELECPLCSSVVSIADLTDSSSVIGRTEINAEIKSIKNRIKELQLLIDQDKEKIFDFEKDQYQYNESLQKLQALLDKEMKSYVSPYLAQREFWIKEKSNLIENQKNLNYHLKIRKQLEEFEAASDVLSSQIVEWNSKLETLKNNLPSIEGILSDLGDYLANYLRYIPIKNPSRISISATTFLPIVRGKNYVELTSGGLRTVVSVGFLLSMLKYSLLNNTNMPSFLMIDTLGKYLGKIKADEIEDEASEELNDPNKYSKMYEYLLEMTKDKEDIQIIVVDNEIPLNMHEELKNKIVKRFGRMKVDGMEIGLIDDI